MYTVQSHGWVLIDALPLPLLRLRRLLKRRITDGAPAIRDLQDSDVLEVSNETLSIPYHFAYPQPEHR